MKAFFLFFFLSIFSFNSWAQHLKLLDSETKKPIEGAVLGKKADEKSPGFCEISDYKGKIKLPFSPGGKAVKLEIHHLSYHNVFITWKGHADTTVFLKPVNQHLNEVVVTAHRRPESAKNVVYKVQVIDREKIEQSGSTDLPAVLAMLPGLNFTQNGATGTSDLVMQGLEGNYVKILVDGIPMVGKSGTEEEIDLSHININLVERVEIVEGPMAAAFGADALAGVINIITKKGAENMERVSVSASWQEETVGSSYGADESKRSGDATVNLRLSPKTTWQASAGWRDFKGWKNEYEGRRYFWHPKEQFLWSSLLRRHDKNLDLYYKISFLDETIVSYGEFSGIGTPTAIDQHFVSNRWTHSLKSTWNFSHTSTLSAYISYADYIRDAETYAVNGLDGSKSKTKSSDFGTAGWNARAEYSRQWKSVNLSVGSDLSSEKGSGDKIANAETLYTAGLFCAAEMRWKDRIKIRPALRYSYHSVYKSPLIPQINIKANLTEQLSLRAAYGKGFRAPSIKELFYSFVDSNHNIKGNKDLNPEKSVNYQAGIQWQNELAKNWMSQWSASAFYNDIEDKIEYFQSVSDATQYTAYNVLSKKTKGLSLEHKTVFRTLALSLNYSYTGVSNELNSKNDEDFGYFSEWAAAASHSLKKWKLNLNLNYKYTGERPIPRENNGIFYMEKVEAHHMLDFTFLKKLPIGFTISGGAKNILNVTALRLEGPGHNAETSQTVGYGRSYYLKLTYQFLK
ncbi:MAG: TonB-dependent receptor [Cytophagales bacterium]|nr:TonB-dependent receptor [Cytophagales bacterium]